MPRTGARERIKGVVIAALGLIAFTVVGGIAYDRLARLALPTDYPPPGDPEGSIDETREARRFQFESNRPKRGRRSPRVFRGRDS